MSLVKGPFTLKWGENTLLDVSEIGFNYDVATNDYETVDGRTYTIDGAITCTVDVTLLATDTAALATVFPQYYVAEGEQMSTGEVAPEGGAIDIVAASCDTSNTNYDLDIIACTGETTRLVNARTSLSSTEIADNALRTVTVTFRGEPGQGEGILQFFGGSLES